MIILNNLVNTGKRMEQEYKNNFKGAMRFTGKYEQKRTIKAEINTRNFLSKFEKQVVL